jgi:hypothetical protein
MREGMTDRRRLIGVALGSAALISLGACATFLGGPSYPAVEGSYRGGVSVEGQGIDGTLEIVQDGAELNVVFDSPSFGLTADGDGTVAEDGTARVFLDYDLQCPGRAELVGEFTDDGTRFSGRVVAVDCTGEISGTFSFRR